MYGKCKHTLVHVIQHKHIMRKEQQQQLEQSTTSKGANTELSGHKSVHVAPYRHALSLTCMSPGANPAYLEHAGHADKRLGVAVGQAQHTPAQQQVQAGDTGLQRLQGTASEVSAFGTGTLSRPWAG
jgi:hypothetical protein